MENWLKSCWNLKQKKIWRLGWKNSNVHWILLWLKLNGGSPGDLGFFFFPLLEFLVLPGCYWVLLGGMRCYPGCRLFLFFSAPPLCRTASACLPLLLLLPSLLSSSSLLLSSLLISSLLFFFFFFFFFFFSSLLFSSLLFSSLLFSSLLLLLSFSLLSSFLPSFLWKLSTWWCCACLDVLGLVIRESAWSFSLSFFPFIFSASCLTSTFYLFLDLLRTWLALLLARGGHRWD